MSTSPDVAPLGEVWAGRYQIRRLLGEGARKRVYLAFDARLEREVALALIKTDGLGAGGLTRVHREAQAMARLGDHPHIVTVYDIGDERGQPFIVSQFMAGGSVEDVLRTVPETTERQVLALPSAGAPHSPDSAMPRLVPVSTAMRLADEICRALEHVHAHGVVHRDLKPANVWLTADGTAKLGDFGLALDRQRSRVTVEGMVVGTVTYMAPEQALGKVVDARTDLYALGVVLYELVTGRPPFVGDDAIAVVSQHLHTLPVAPSWHNAAVTPELEALILRLLEKEPERRPQSAAAVHEALARCRSAVTEKSTAAAQPVPPLASASQSGVLNPLDRLDAGVFVGREKEMATLRGAVEDALGGRGVVALIGGEPGIGKTRLAQHIATYAQLRDMQVLWGRGYEGGAAPAYWPWVQIIRGYVHGRTAQDLRHEMGSGAAEIATVFSEIRERLPELPAAPRLEPEQERFRFFDSVGRFLNNAAARRPLMLILDDAQWADPSSLHLLQFLAREIADARLIVLVTYRDEEVQRGHPLYETLAELARTAVSQRLLLRGLDAPAVQQLIERTAGEAAPASLVAAVSRQTEGNPFFAGEVVRWLVSEGRLHHAATEGIGVPPSVREVVGRRLDRLSPACNQLLAIAAVIGRDFDVRVLQATTEAADLPTAPAAVLDLLEEAVSARVLVEASRHSPDRYVFAHALIREALYAELSTTRRLRLHQQIGRAIEAVYDNRAPHLAALAYHFGEAAALGESRAAVDYDVRAGARAGELLAYEDAVGHYERALAVLDRQPDADDALRCEILLQLGDNQFRIGDRDHARTTFQRALQVARQLAQPDRLARAALGFAAPFVTRLAYEVGAFDADMVAALEEALAGLPADDSTLRVRVLSCLANALEWSPRFRHRTAPLSEEAVAMARRIGESATLTAALLSRCIALDPMRCAEERLAVETELLEIARRHDDRHMTLVGHDLRRLTLLQLGRIDALERDVATFEQLAETSRQPQFHYHVLQWRGMRAFLDGRFDDAERLATETLAAGNRIQNRGALQGIAVQMAMLKRERGTFGELEGSFRALVAQYPQNPAWRGGLALLLSEDGRRDDARRELQAMEAHGGFDPDRGGALLALGAVLATDVCRTLPDPERAAQLYALLLPYANLHILVVGAACFGSAARYLGVLATTVGRWDEADAHFATALAMNTALHARVWAAHTQHDWATMLLQRDRPGDRATAKALMDAAIETAHALGMKALLEQALSRRLQSHGADAHDMGGSIDAVAAEVTAAKPDLRPQAAPDGTVTVLFSDIEGFTAITERLGDRRAHALLSAHNRIVREQLRRHGGFEVKSQGDGFMIVFQSAHRAVLCAIALQRALAGHAAEQPQDPIRVRIGLHTGEAIKEGNDFFGTTVNLAARIAAQARGGEILVSSVLKALVDSTGELHFGNARAVVFKGLSGVRSVFPVRWSGEPDGGATMEAPANAAVLRHEGAYWTLSHDGATNRLKDARGLQYLSLLLRHPGQEFHALDVVQAPGQQGTEAGRRTSHPADQAILDAPAKAAYKRRIAELREELEEAEQFNDSGRIERARSEIEAISEELARAVGLGGRDRSSASAAQRARVAVTKRIKEAVARIGECDAVLGDYLHHCIKTGLFCVYQPDLSRAIDWRLD